MPFRVRDLFSRKQKCIANSAYILKQIRKFEMGEHVLTGRYCDSSRTDPGDCVDNDSHAPLDRVRGDDTSSGRHTASRDLASRDLASRDLASRDRVQCKQAPRNRPVMTVNSSRELRDNNEKTRADRVNSERTSGCGNSTKDTVKTDRDYSPTNRNGTGSNVLRGKRDSSPDASDINSYLRGEVLGVEHGSSEVSSSPVYCYPSENWCRAPSDSELQKKMSNTSIRDVESRERVTVEHRLADLTVFTGQSGSLEHINSAVICKSTNQNHYSEQIKSKGQSSHCSNDVIDVDNNTQPGFKFSVDDFLCGQTSDRAGQSLYQDKSSSSHDFEDKLIICAGRRVTRSNTNYEHAQDHNNHAQVHNNHAQDHNNHAQDHNNHAQDHNNHAQVHNNHAQVHNNHAHKATDAQTPPTKPLKNHSKDKSLMSTPPLYPKHAKIRTVGVARSLTTNSHVKMERGDDSKAKTLRNTKWKNTFLRRLKLMKTRSNGLG